jgi:hypothetical protein
MHVLQFHWVSSRQRLKVCSQIPSTSINLQLFIISATHLNNGPTSEPSPAAQQQQQHQQQQQQQQQQQPPVTISNKRPAPSNPVSTVQVPPIENGLDYRGHHPMNSNQPPLTSQVSQSSNIRFNQQLSPSKIVVLTFPMLF